MARSTIRSAACLLTVSFLIIFYVTRPHGTDASLEVGCIGVDITVDGERRLKFHTKGRSRKKCFQFKIKGETKAKAIAHLIALIENLKSTTRDMKKKTGWGYCTMISQNKNNVSAKKNICGDNSKQEKSTYCKTKGHSGEKCFQFKINGETKYKSIKHLGNCSYRKLKVYHPGHEEEIGWGY